MISFESSHGAVWIDPVGAVIHGCRIDDVWVMPDTRSTGSEFASGEQLFPWPNRLRDGRWLDEGTVRSFELTEPSRSNAIHGLLRSVSFNAETTADGGVLRGTLPASDGYPWTIACEFHVVWERGGLMLRSSFRNLGDRPAPWAFGSHPYIALPGRADEITLTVAADRMLLTDEQMIPVEEVAVSGTAYDYRAGVPVQSVEVDHAFRRTSTAVEVIASLASPTHRCDVWADAQFGTVQVFRPPWTCPLHAGGPTVAIEPMTAPADAFNSGDGLRWLDPNESVSLAWGVRLTSVS